MQIAKGEGCLMERFRVRYEDIKPGAIVIYKLRRNQRPVHAEKEWRGKVLLYNRFIHRAVVESLEEGYEECEDDVWLEQIIRIEEDDHT
jgi:hypothetical protein